MNDLIRHLESEAGGQLEESVSMKIHLFHRPIVARRINCVFSTNSARDG